MIFKSFAWIIWSIQSRSSLRVCPLSIPKVLSDSCPRRWMSRLLEPKSTSIIALVPKRSPIRCTHERIFCAMTLLSLTTSISPKHTSQAPQLSVG